MLRNFISGDFGIFSGSIPDILAVMEGIKPMARLSCSPSELPKGLAFLREAGLACETSERVYASSYYIYVSKSEDIARDSKKADNSFRNIRSNRERSRSIMEFGRLLGYPECCSSFLARNMDRKGSSLGEKFAPKRRMSFLANNILNGVTNHYFSFHYPCSYDCRETLNNAGRLYRAMGRELPDMRSEVDMYLRSPFLVFFDLGLDYSNSWDTRKGFWFDGTAREGAIFYNRAIFFETCFPEYNERHMPGLGRLREAVTRGDAIMAEGKTMKVWSGDRLLYEHRNKEKCWASVFDFS